MIYKSAEDCLKALAFILSQEGLIADLPYEQFVVGPYRPFQIKLRQVEQRTKLEVRTVVQRRSAGERRLRISCDGGNAEHPRRHRHDVTGIRFCQLTLLIANPCIISDKASCPLTSLTRRG